MIYDPDEFEDAHEELLMEEWRLSEEELRRQAVICSAHRENLRMRALQYEMSDMAKLN